jgi:hypothetical protein
MDLVQKNIFVFGGRTDGKEAQQHKREKERTTEFGIGRGERGERGEEEGYAHGKKVVESTHPSLFFAFWRGREGDRRSRVFFFPGGNNRKKDEEVDKCARE